MVIYLEIHLLLDRYIPTVRYMLVSIRTMSPQLKILRSTLPLAHQVLPEDKVLPFLGAHNMRHLVPLLGTVAEMELLDTQLSIPSTQPPTPSPAKEQVAQVRTMIQ